MTDPICEPRLDDPDTWPHWPTLKLINVQWDGEGQPWNGQIGWMVDIEVYHRTVFLIDGNRFHAAVEDPEYPLSNLPHKEYPSTTAILQDGWSPTI